jgi:hypothetical protein
MIQPSLTFSSPERAKAVSYLVDYGKGRPLVEALGRVFPETGEVTLVTAGDPPEEDYFSDLGRPSCTDWLIEEISRYLRETPLGLFLFEDLVSTPSDPGLARGNPPPYWTYRNRVFWPVTPDRANYETVEQALAWAAPRAIGAFTILPRSISRSSGPVALSEEEFQTIASSTSRIVVEVFDGGGFMIWSGRD